ncbi:MAG: hypothetical protein Q9227_008899 [Pyrenula ochraceoflavens]
MDLLIRYGARYENVQDDDGEDVLFCAIENLDVDVLRWAIDHSVKWIATNKYGFTPMLKAALFNRIDQIKQLHDAGFLWSVPSQPHDGGDSENGIRHTSVWYAFRALKCPYERLAVHDRYIPLMVSAFKGHLEAVEYFYDHFPDMRTCGDKDGNDALTYACCSGNLFVVKFLTANGFAIDRVNVAERSVQGEIEQVLECLKEDHSKEGGTDEVELKNLISDINDVLVFLRFQNEFSSDARGDNQDNSDRENQIEDSQVEANVTRNLNRIDLNAQEE